MKSLKHLAVLGFIFAAAAFPGCNTGDSESTPVQNPATYSVTVADDIKNGTVSVDKTSAKEGETITLTATATHEGYHFDTFTVKKGDETVAVTKFTFVMPAGNVTVNATFAPNTYTVTYELDGGTFVSEDYATSYTIESDEITLPSATKEGGYTFKGWKKENDETGMTIIPKGSTGNVTLTAIWVHSDISNLIDDITSEVSISIEKVEDVSKITLAATLGFSDYTWRIDGTLASSFTGAKVTEDGTGLILEKASLISGQVYQISLFAKKDNIPCGTQISIKL